MVMTRFIKYRISNIFMLNKTDKAQGEIFGIALFFVIIILAIIIFSKFSVVNSDDEDNFKGGKYKIMAEGSINTILSMETGCVVERGKSTLKDLMLYCLENSYGSSDIDITCDSGTEHACEYSKALINETLYNAFNSTTSKGLGMIPFEFKMDIPANQESKFANNSFSNIRGFTFTQNRKPTTIPMILDQEQAGRKLRANGYNLVSSGLISWATAQRPIEMELQIYYR